MFGIVVRHGGNHCVSSIREASDLADAVHLALELADTLGLENGGPSPEKRYVDIVRDGRIEISISVMRGGLAGQPS